MTFVGLGMVLATLALAGAFYNNGAVNPTSGYANTTLFTYTVCYQLSDGQSAPDAYVDIYRGSTLWDSRMMAFLIINRIVYYTYTTTLPAGGNYGFLFRTFDDSTDLTSGPTVS